MSDPGENTEAPGWAAIDRAFAGLYPAVEPQHFGAVPVALGGGVDGVSVFPADRHWHFVTYGLTELYEKQADSLPDQSGQGYELTFRVPRREEDDVPPRWALNLVDQVAKSAWRGTGYEPGHRLQCGPITGDEECRLIALAFTVDPELPETIQGPNGRFVFLQMVGITAEELDEMKASSTPAVLGRLQDGNPRLVTDPAR